jgi:DNA-binding SARP family transcriptional activator
MVGLLGPLRLVGEDGGEVRPGAPKERAVLAVLGLRVGTVVAVSELIDAVWGEDPPASAAKAIQTYVSSLRRRLPAGAIVTVGDGYRLNVDPEAVDVMVFGELVAAGQQALAAGDAEAAVGSLRGALGLWRGEPLVELADQHGGRPRRPGWSRAGGPAKSCTTRRVWPRVRPPRWWAS